MRVKPGASQSFVGGSYGEPPALVVSVKVHPVDGKASEAVVTAIAKAFDVSSRAVDIVTGHAARTKHVVVTMNDDRDEEFNQRLMQLLQI